jgi:hypothetical protein
VSAPGSPSFDVEHAERLALEAARGDEASFGALLLVIWPELDPARKPVDEVADRPEHAVPRMIDKMRQDDFRALRLYEDWRARHRDKSFADWLRIVAATVTRDVLRSLREVTTGTLSPPDGKQLLEAFSVIRSAEELGARSPRSWTEAREELLDLARERLPEAQHRALADWLLRTASDAGPSTGHMRAIRATVTMLRREVSRRA